MGGEVVNLLGLSLNTEHVEIVLLIVLVFVFLLELSSIRLSVLRFKASLNVV